MKITLIYPPISVVERYGTDIGDIGGRQAPLGILYLAAFLQKEGYEVQVIDAEAERLNHDSIIRRIKEFNPKWVGLSITTVAFKNAQVLAKIIHQTIPNLPIIVGGPHVTANPVDSLNEECFKVGVYKEGEITLLEMLRNFDDFSKYPKIKGIIYRDMHKKVIVNDEREYINNLSGLTFPARDLLSDIRLYRPPIGCYQEEFVVSVMTSRGCPYRCIFCDNNTFGRGIRYFSPEYVVDEISMILNKYKARELTFVDDTFPSNRRRFRKILELILERELKFSWTCMASVNDLNEEILSLMKQTGCWQIALGIESGDDDILKLIQKGTNTKKIREAVKLADKAGILVKGFFMLGHPTETKDTLKKTLDFALELPLTDVTCTISTPIRGTTLYDMAISQEYGRFNASADSSQFSYWEPVFIPSGLTADELFQTQREFFKRFYLRPGILLRQLKKIRSFLLLKRYIQTIKKILTSRQKTYHKGS